MCYNLLGFKCLKELATGLAVALNNTFKIHIKMPKVLWLAKNKLDLV